MEELLFHFFNYICPDNKKDCIFAVVLKFFKVMINRRLLRIKVLQVYYAYVRRENASLSSGEKELLHSIEKSFDLYYLLFQLIIDIVTYAESRIILAGQKKMPSYDDLHPNTAFTDLWFVKELSVSPSFNKVIDQKKLSWINHQEVVKRLYLDIYESDNYKFFMSKESNPEDEKAFIVRIYSEIIATSEDLSQCLEEQSIYWNDDMELAISDIIKTIKRSKPGNLLLPAGDNMFKNKEDKDFAIRLFHKTVLHQKDNKALIEQQVENWDVDRIALMDTLIMELAITEMVEFPEIPVKVSLNEYIELSKWYSSNKSANFINGILDKITVRLRESKTIVKRGKGLVGEV